MFLLWGQCLRKAVVKLNLVEKAVIRPMKCVFYPQIGHDHPKGYVDTGMDMLGVDPHAYISIQAIEDIATYLGYLAPAENERMCSDLASAHEEIIKLEQEIKEADEVINAIDVIESREFRARKKPGRKVSKPERDPELVA